MKVFEYFRPKMTWNRQTFRKFSATTTKTEMPATRTFPSRQGESLLLLKLRFHGDWERQMSASNTQFKLKPFFFEQTKGDFDDEWSVLAPNCRFEFEKVVTKYGKKKISRKLIRNLQKKFLKCKNRWKFKIVTISKFPSSNYTNW